MRRHATVAALAILALALGVSGCAKNQGEGVATANGGTSTTDGETNEVSNLTPEEKMLKFAQCMRDNGVDVPDPELGGGGGGFAIRMDGEGAEKDKFDKAMEACRQYGPSADQQREPDPAMAENMLKFAQCMRDNGVEAFKDPEGNAMMLEREVAEDPDFQSAQEKCEKEFLPGITRQGGGPGGPPGGGAQVGGSTGGSS